MRPNALKGRLLFTAIIIWRPSALKGSSSFPCLALQKPPLSSPEGLSPGTPVRPECFCLREALGLAVNKLLWAWSDGGQQALTSRALTCQGSGTVCPGLPFTLSTGSKGLCLTSGRRGQRRKTCPFVPPSALQPWSERQKRESRWEEEGEE